MIGGTSTNDKSQHSNSEHKKRNPYPEDEFNSVQYNKMVDDSKHTEDGDMSRLEYADHHFQDTNRNLKRTSEIDISTE